MNEHLFDQPKNLAEIAAALRTKSRILVASHTSPDGDALGSTLGLGLLLEALGHDVFFYNQDAIPDIYQFLPGANRIQRHIPHTRTFDFTLVIDVFDKERAGLKDVRRENLGKMIILDHHFTTEKHGDFQYIDTGAAASGVLVYRLAKQLQVSITPEMALNIYACIMTDTGSFHYSSANPEAYAIAGEMVALGVEPWEFARRVYESYPANRFFLLAEVLKSLEISANGKYAFIYLSMATLERFGADADLTDGFINYPRSIAGVEVSIFLREKSAGKFKASFRSSGAIDVRPICFQLGGGGHRNAAGCNIEGSYAEVKEKILSLTQKVCEENLNQN